MAELVLKLHVDPKTGKKAITADYKSDADALPSEHEEEHRRLVGKLVEGTPLAGGDLDVDRQLERPGASDEAEAEPEEEVVDQKS
jgi:hypothetical protein